MRLRWSLVKTYRAMSAASVEKTWQKLTNLTDVSWNPMLASTDAPLGLLAKPGLIYPAMSRWNLIPFRLFIESVEPNRFLSIRMLAVPGLEERVTYQISKDMSGTSISYSIMLKGWLTPIVWTLFHSPAKQVARQLARAAEVDSYEPKNTSWLARVIDF